MMRRMRGRSATRSWSGGRGGCHAQGAASDGSSERSYTSSEDTGMGRSPCAVPCALPSRAFVTQSMGNTHTRMAWWPDAC